MSSSIDEKIVSLKFDNSQFKRNADSSLKQLARIDKLTTFGKGKLKSYIGQVALNSLSGAVDVVRGKFSALEVMGITALANITNSAVNAGKEIASALTLRPVMDGFQEYELKIKSMRTIMASTGEDVNTVNKYIEELNTYADKTIYSFSDMTDNIGKFTNAGVKLPDAVKAIQGISNAAALAGSDAGQASHAMYNFAQALAAGYVKLIDWKSIEIAGMATQQFKEELIKTGVELGTLTKQGEKYISTTKSLQNRTSEAFDATQGFTDSLQYQWLSSDVLITTLGKYSDETTKLGKAATDAATQIRTFSQLIDTTKEALGTGWGESFEIVIGNIDEAKNLWTMVGDVVGEVINKTANARNAMLRQWKELGGREVAIEALSSSYKALLSVLGPIKKGFENVFPPLTGKRLYELTIGFKNFVDTLRLTEDQSKNLKDTAEGVFTLFKNFKEVISGIVKFATPITGKVLSGILSITGALGRFITGADKLADFSDVVSDVFTAIGEDVKVLVDTVMNTLDMLDLGARIENFFKFISDGFKKYTNVSSIAEVIRKMFTDVATFIRDGLDIILGTGGFADKLNNALTAGALAAVFTFATNMSKVSKNLRKTSSYLARPIKLLGEVFNSMSEPANAVVATLNAIKDVLAQWQKSLKADILMQLAVAIGILSASLAILASIDTKRLHNAIAAMSTLVADLVLGPGLLSKFQVISGSWQLSQFIGFAVGIAILAHTLKTLADVDAKSLAKGITALSIIIGAMTIAMAKLSGPPMIAFLKHTDEFGKSVARFQNGSMLRGVLMFAIAIALLGEELQRIGKMDWGSIAKGLAGIGGIMAELLIFSKYMDKQRMLAFDPKAMAGMIIMAASLRLLVDAMQQFDNVSAGGVVKGIVSMVAMVLAYSQLLKAMSGLSKSLVFGTDILKMAAGMAIVALSFRIFADAMGKFSDLGNIDYVKGIGSFYAMVGGMVALMRASYLFHELDPNAILKAAAAMVVMSAAFGVFASAMTMFNGMDWSTFVMGISSFASMVVGLVAALKVLSHVHIDPASMLSLGAAFVLLGGSFILLAKGMNIMEGIDLVDIANGIIALTSVLVLFAGASELLKGASLASFAELATAFFVISAGIALAAPGLMILSAIPFEGIAAGLAALAGVLVIFGAAATVFEAVVVPMTLCALVFIELAAAFAIFGAGVALITTGLVNASQAILSFAVITGAQLALATDNIVQFISSILTLVPVVAGTIVETLLEVVDRIAQSIGPIAEDLVDIITVVVKEVTQSLPELIEILLKGLVDSLKSITKYLQPIVDEIVNFVISLADSLGNNAYKFTDAGLRLVESLLNGMADGMSKHTEAINAAVSNLAKSFGDFTTNAFLGVVEGAGIAIGEMLGKILGKAVEAAMQSLPEIGEKLSEFGEAASDFFFEMSGMTPEVMKGTKYLADAIATLTSVSIKDSLFGGKNSLKNLGKDLSAFASSFTSMSFTEDNYNTVKNVGKALYLMAKVQSAIPRSGGFVSKAIVGERGSIKDFAKSIVKTAKEIVGISKVKGLDKVNDDLIKNVTNVCKVIAKMNGLAQRMPKTGGLRGAIFGDNTSISSFTKSISASIKSLGKLAANKNTAKIDNSLITSVSNTCKAITKISNLAQSLPRTGGIFNAFIEGHIGSIDIGPFTEMLHNAMISLAGLAKLDGENGLTNVYKINDKFVSRVTKTVGIISQLVPLIKKIPSINTGGGAVKFNLEPFTTGLSNAMTSLGRLASMTGKDSKVDTSKIDADFVKRVGQVVSVLKSILGLLPKMPKTGGSIDSYTGTFKITPFTDMLVEASTALSGLASSADVDMESINDDLVTRVGNVINVMRQMIDLSKTIPRKGGTIDKLITFFSGEQSIGPFTEALSDAMISLGSLASLNGEGQEADLTKIDEAFIERVTSVIKVLGSLVELSKTLPQPNATNGTMPNMNIEPIVTIITTATESLAKLAGSDAIDVSSIDETFVTSIGSVIGVLTDILDIIDLMPDAPTEADPGKNLDVTPILSIITDSVTKLAEIAGSDELKKVIGDDTLVTGVSTVIDIINQLIELSGGLSAGNGSGSATMDSISTDMDISALVGQINTAATEIAKLADNEGLKKIGDGGAIVYHVQGIASVISEVSTAVAPLSSNGGVMKAIGNFIKSKIDFATFKSKIDSIATNLKDLVGSNNPFKGLSDNGALADLDAVAACIDKFKDIVTKANGLKVNGGTDGSELVTLAENLNMASPKLSAFSSAMESVSLAQVNKASTTVEKMSAAAQSGDTGEDLVTLGENLEQLGISLANFSSSTEGLDPTNVYSTLEALGAVDIDLSGFEAFAEGVRSAMAKALKAIQPKSFATKGKACITQLAKAIGKHDSVKKAGASAGKAGADGAQSSRSGWETAGRYCVEGLASGIRNSAWIARNAATIAALQALAAAKAAFQQKSPSRAFYRIGVFNNLGLAKGFEAPKGKAAIKRAIVKTGNYAVKTLSKGPMKQIAKSISKSSALVNQTPKTFAQSFGKSFVKALHKLPKKTNKALHKLIDVKNFDKKHILKQGQALVKTYRTALNKASIATKAKYSPFNANALIKTKNGLEATATYLAASVKNGKISNALATTSKTLVKKINTLFKAGVKSGKWGKNSKSGMKQVTEQIIKDATEGYNNLQRILATLPKKYAKIMNHAASSVGKFIANNKSVTKYASGAISQFDKIYGDQLSASRKRNNKLIKQWDRDMGAYVEERDSLTRFINGNKGKKLKGQDKKNYDAAKKRLTYVNKQIADLNKVKGKINTLRKENKKYSSVKSIVQSFGEQLYANSTDGKQQIKAFEKAADNYEKARKKRNKQQQKLDNWDKKNGKRYNSLRKKDAKSLSDGEKKELKKLTDQRKKITKELDKLKKDTKNKLKALDTEAGKLGKGVEKALKTFRNEVKETVKAMGALSNVKLAEDLFSGFNWESQTEKFDIFSATVGKSLEKVSSTTTTVKQSIQAATEAFDVLSNAFDTGIDPFEKFTNTGTVDPEALFEYRKTQHEAYKDWRSMMDELKARGLHESMIELLEQQGVSAINRVRGFIAMSEDQLKEYNKFCQEEIDLQTDALSRSTEQQDEEYQKWMANVEKLQTDKGKFISADLLDKIRAAGVSSSKTVELMLNMTDDALSKFSVHYANAISDTYVNFASIEKAVGEASKKAGEEAGENTATGFLDSLRKANKENDAWEELLGDLKAAGFSKEVVDRFREMGSDAGTEWAKSLLEDVRKDNSSEAIKEIIRQVDELEAKLNGMSPDDTGYADIVNQIVSLEAQARESMNSVVREVNQAVADSIPDPFEAAIKNLEEENKAYEEYKKNSLAIEAEIGNAKTEQQKKLKKVYESLHELGFSEAEGVKYLANATTEQVSRMYDDLEKREENNKENRSNQLFEDYHKIKTAQNDYAKNLEWLSENVFTAVSNSGLTKEQREKAQKELLDQLRSMSIEDANAYIEALKYGMEHEGDEFSQWQKDFYQSNFSIPSSVADKVTAEAAAIYTGFTQVATQTVASGAASIEAALKKAASEIPGSEAAAQLNESGKTVGKKLVGATKNYVTAKAPGVGVSVLEGIPKGLTDKVALDKLIKSCEGLGSTVIKSTKKTLKSNSPSKVFIGIGKGLDAGLAIGMRDNMSIPTEAATALAEEVTNYAAMAYSMISTLAENEDLNITPNIAIDGIEAETSEIDAFMDSLSMLLALASGELDTNPVITPELDISLVRKQAQNVNSLFDNTQANIRALAAGTEVQSEPATMQFIQNNYSPKALDQLEIYRQTRNQFAAVKGLVYR